MTQKIGGKAKLVEITQETSCKNNKISQLQSNLIKEIREIHKLVMRKCYIITITEQVKIFKRNA